MKRFLFALALAITAIPALLSSCAGSGSVHKTETNYASALNETPEKYEDWATAYAIVLSERGGLGLAGVDILDIDEDGIPEAVEYVITSYGALVSRIYGYENNECSLWYDTDIGDQWLSRVFFVKNGEAVACVATYITYGTNLSHTELGVYELLKGNASGRTAIVPATILKTSCSLGTYWDNCPDELENSITALNKAQEDLYALTLSAIGEVYASARICSVSFMYNTYTEEELMRMFHEW